MRSDNNKYLSLSNLITMMCCFLLLVASGFWLYFLQSGVSRIVERQQQDYQSMVMAPLLHQVAEWTLAENTVSLNLALKDLVDGNWVVEAQVVAADQSTLAQQRQTKPLPERIDSQSYTLNLEGRHLGQLQLWFDPQPEQAALNSLWGSLIFSTFMLVVILASFAKMFGQKISQQIKQFSQALLALQNNPDSAELPSTAILELHQLRTAIAEQSRKANERSQVHSALSNFMATNGFDHTGLPYDNPTLPDQYIHSAVLFIDIANLHSIQQRLTPAEFTQLLNHYYFLINQAAKLYNGQVDRYMGQGLMLLFGIPTPDEKDNFHGLCAGMLILGMLNQFNAERQRQKQPTLQFRLGLHSGMLLAAAFGEQDNLNFSVVGDEINLAARLSRSGHPGQMLISEVLLNHGDISNNIDFMHAGPITQGDDQLNTFLVKSLKDNYSRLIERQVTQILAAYPSSPTAN